MKKDTIVFDLDGTLANIDHRTHYIKDRDNPRWDLFFAACPQDTPNEWCFEILRTFAAVGYDIKIVSARSREVQRETREWLAKHIPPEVAYELCMLRAPGEYTPDTTLKQAWLDSFQKDRILFVVDDRARVVNMWRANGLTCLQCSDWEEKEMAARKAKKEALGKKGFTLIELMIVVAIIGVLAAIAIPKFAQLINTANCKNGDIAACDRIRSSGKESSASASPASVDPADDSKWEQIRGRIVSVQFKDASDGLKDRWYVVIKQSDGTIRNAMLGKPAVQDVEACIAVTPDQVKWFDELVQCK